MSLPSVLLVLGFLIFLCYPAMIADVPDHGMTHVDPFTKGHAPMTETIRLWAILAATAWHQRRTEDGGLTDDVAHDGNPRRGRRGGGASPCWRC